MSGSSAQNSLCRMVNRLQSLPLGGVLLNLVLSRKIPFVGTASIEILKMTQHEVVVKVVNHRKVRNHIGQVHAAAMMLLGETASGLLAGMNVPDQSLPLIKSMTSQFVKRSTGDLVAKVQLPVDKSVDFSVEKGEISLRVEVSDQAGIEPVVIEAIWAWIPKVKKVTS